MTKPKLSLRVLACEVAQREICCAASDCPSLLELEFLPVGHHDDPRAGHADLQSRIDAVPPGRFDAILVGYGICSLMLEGLKSRHTPLVIPRAHDCITFFLGSKERYQERFTTGPGTYYFTAGWLEFPQRKMLRSGGLDAMHKKGEDLAAQTTPFGLGQNFEELVAKYGEENARYLLEVSNQWSANYQCGALITFGCAEKLALRDKVAEICRGRGWRFEELPGDLGLLQRWLAGQWDEQDFLVVPPQHSVHPSYDERIIDARPVPDTRT